MTICVEDAMVVEDVAGSDQATKEIFKADLLAFWEVSGGHGRFVGLK